MKALRVRLSQAASSSRVRQEIIEQDYVMGHVLASLYSNAKLSSVLIFKRGTALKLESEKRNFKILR